MVSRERLVHVFHARETLRHNRPQRLVPAVGLIPGVAPLPAVQQNGTTGLMAVKCGSKSLSNARGGGDDKVIKKSWGTKYKPKTFAELVPPSSLSKARPGAKKKCGWGEWTRDGSVPKGASVFL